MKLGNVMIFGDSYSTYEGYVPEGYLVYYTGHRTEVPDVSDVKNTWWGRLLDATDSTLVQNNSWSGSTIGYTGYNNTDCSHSSSFIYRFEKLLADGFFSENKIDTLFVFGGTNDSWCEAPLGEAKRDGIEESDLYSVLPAINHYTKRLAEELKDTRIIFIVNNELKKEITDTLISACKRHGFEYIALSDIEKIEGHPTELGMEQICSQILAHLK